MSGNEAAGASDLIYDVGVHNGDDSAYYLHKGYRVVGIEANPLMLPLLRRRFDSELRDGRYTLLPVGIAQAAGEAQFWVCDDRPEWSSFDRAIASRNGARHHCVTVRTCRFESVLASFGAAAYCKIDIEGNDDLCLEDLGTVARPRFLSVELVEGDRQLHRLRELGYTKFKIVSQRTFRQVSIRLLQLKALLPSSVRRLLTSGEARMLRHGSDGAWRFPPGSSGPFGEATAGEWRSFDHALDTWRNIDAAAHDLSDWYDIHAA